MRPEGIGGGGSSSHPVSPPSARRDPVRGPAKAEPAPPSNNVPPSGDTPPSGDSPSPRGRARDLGRGGPAPSNPSGSRGITGRQAGVARVLTTGNKFSDHRARSSIQL